MATVTGILQRLTRLDSTYVGNPRWRVRIENKGVWLTQADAAFVFDIDPSHLGQVVTLELNEHGRITAYQVGEGPNVQPDLVQKLDIKEMLADPPHAGKVGCSMCGVWYLSEEALGIHIRMIHEGLQPGAQITTADQLALLPDMSIVRDLSGYAWQKLDLIEWARAGLASRLRDKSLIPVVGLVTLVYKP